MLGAALLLLREALRRGVVVSPLPAGAGMLGDPVDLLTLLLLPGLVLVAGGRNPVSYFRVGRAGEIRPIGAASVLLVVVGAGLVATTTSMQRSYAAPTAPWHFVVSTLVALVPVEFFFRGFLLFALVDAVGRAAIPLAAIPYCLIHLGRPLPELLGSLVFGCWLGSIAVRTSSVLYGLALHWLVAVCIPLWMVVVR